MKKIELENWLLEQADNFENSGVKEENEKLKKQIKELNRKLSKAFTMLEEEYEVAPDYESNVLSWVAPVWNEKGNYVVEIGKIV